MNYKSIRPLALRYTQLASTRSEHFEAIVTWCEFADALMSKLEWPEELWEPSPLHAGDLSPFFTRESPDAPIIATMRVKVDPSRDHFPIVFRIEKQEDGTFIISGKSNESLWHTLHKKLIPKADEYILKCFHDVAHAKPQTKND